MLLVCAIAGIAVLRPSKVAAQWWSRTPTDFEDCADAAERASTREARTDALAECNAKFAGRRKPGGGYTYYDFMQDRTFDIAGPNPTQEEQKRIDEQYALYLEKQRRNSIAAAFAAQQQQQQEPVQQNAMRAEAEREEPVEPAERIPLPHQRPTKAQMDAATAAIRRAKCAKSRFSCDFPNLSETLNDLKKKLFGSQQGQQGKTKKI